MAQSIKLNDNTYLDMTSIAENGAVGIHGLRFVYLDANSSIELKMNRNMGMIFYKRNDNFGVIFIELYTATTKKIGDATGNISVSKSANSHIVTVTNALSYGMPMYVVGF